MAKTKEQVGVQDEKELGIDKLATRISKSKLVRGIFLGATLASGVGMGIAYANSNSVVAEVAPLPSAAATKEATRVPTLTGQSNGIDDFSVWKVTPDTILTPEVIRLWSGQECIAKPGLDFCPEDQFCRLLKNDPDNAEKERAGNCALKATPLK